MFAYLISKWLCNDLAEFGCQRRIKCFSGTKTSFGSRETYLESLLKVLGRKNYLLYVYPNFYFGSQSCHSLHDWFILGALAADTEFIQTRSKVVSRKALNGLKRIRSLLKALSKPQTVRIILPRGKCVKDGHCYFVRVCSLLAARRFQQVSFFR